MKIQRWSAASQRFIDLRRAAGCRALRRTKPAAGAWNSSAVRRCAQVSSQSGGCLYLWAARLCCCAVRVPTATTCCPAQSAARCKSGRAAPRCSCGTPGAPTWQLAARTHGPAACSAGAAPRLRMAGRVGGALLKGLPERLAHETGMPIRIAPRPLEAVALGSGQALEEFEVLQGVLFSSARD